MTRRSLAPLMFVTAVALLGVPAGAQQAVAINATKYNELYERYLTSARKSPAPSTNWMADLTTDPKARRRDDLVTVSVIENLTATGSADANVQKKTDADVKIPMPRIAQELARVLPHSAETDFNGSGGTTRSTQLSATLTARVVEVLPNGDLVIEGVREIDINGDRSLIVLTGVVRSIDIGQANVVSSSRIGQLQIKSLSQGLIKDSLTPGWLIRILNKVF